MAATNAVNSTVADRAGQVTRSTPALALAAVTDAEPARPTTSTTPRSVTKPNPTVGDDRLSPNQSRWDHFYKDSLEPLFQFTAAAATAIAVLIMLSGLLTQWMVKVDSVAWPDRELKWTSRIAFLLLMICGSMLPVYAMFRPSWLTAVPPWAVDLILGVLFISAVVVVVVGEKPRGDEPVPFQRPVRNLWRLLIVLVPIGTAGIILMYIFPEHHHRLLWPYVAVSLYSVLLTAATYGQKLRLQVEAQTSTGSRDTAATDYLLARMKTLGTESSPQTKNSFSAAPTAASPLSTLKSEDLSALPAGKVAGAVSQLFFVLRPDLTWRARVTVVDANRVAITLSRNHQHADSAIFSRLDLGLPCGEDASAKDRQRAQLLTGAAAFILVRLGRAYPEHQQVLAGARNWTSVALQVIATSRSLIDAPEHRVPLLARAVDDDPGYLLARLEYLWALQEDVACDTPLYLQITEATTALLPQTKRKGLEPLRIRALYRNATQWINLHAQGGFLEYQSHRKASYAVTKLRESIKDCENSKPTPQTEQFLRRIKPLADILWQDVQTFTRFPPKPPTPIYFRSPRSSYESACLNVLWSQQDKTDPGFIEDAVAHLRLSLPDPQTRTTAWKDPCFKLLRANPDYQQLIYNRYLDLQVFASTAGKLTAAGMDRPETLARRTATPAHLAELADYLGVSPLLVERMRKIALLACIHRDLAEPAMLQLLLDIGIDSPQRLQEEIRSYRKRPKLLTQLREHADELGLGTLSGIKNPRGWCEAVRRQSPNGL